MVPVTSENKLGRQLEFFFKRIKMYKMIFLVQPSTALHVTFVLNILNLGNAHLAFNYETHIFK